MKIKNFLLPDKSAISSLSVPMLLIDPSYLVSIFLIIFLLVMKDLHRGIAVC
jgi:hypothetical protein